MWTKRINKEIENTTPGVNVSLKELINLRHQAILVPISTKYKSLKHSGQKLTNVQGRGIDFEKTREYQAGDDIRNMAWRVTARNLKPHIKIYQEEKERPVWLAVDLSPSLYFGTRCMFKSVRGIKQAALLGWSHLNQNERIGAMIATETQIHHFKPRAGEQQYLNILNTLSAYSSKHPEFNENHYLQPLLLNLQQELRAGSLVVIISDFIHFNADIQKLLIHLAQRAQVALSFIYDPFEATPPPPFNYILTNGQQKALFNMNNAKNRQQYQAQFSDRKNALIDFARKHNVTLEILSTEADQQE